ncbi:AraC family transcriptional regulator [Hahella sp. CCB-MM4]|uniref:AraC family transcriptional regulator n=1 Tax=Hahella sp. (strain CCB-MM4) TaxID=1926491 RepID=UPI000B9BBF98|nr:AraC family transcriptional regulator [Hahella sp. CCB-MM4]OZG73930.1 AraC family transcriptional regulator [Hahella sp. CCB-MM4]
MKNLGFASVAAVNQYLRFAEDHGLDCDQALKAASVERARLAEGSSGITGIQFQAILKNLIQQSNDPLLGLNSGDYVQPGSYNVLGYIVMSCATLGEAIERIAPFEKLVGDMGVTTLEPWETDPDMVLIRWHCAYPDPEVRPHMVDNVFASWVNFSRWLANNDSAAPEQLLLQKSSPTADQLPTYKQRYQEIFHCPVLYDQKIDALVFRRALLDIPLRQPDQLLRKTLEGHATQQIKSLEMDDTPDIIREIKQRLQQQLSEGITRQDMVAESMNITSRTLQRRLNEHGYTYQQLLDEVRLESARQLLKHSQMAITDIAYQLGFAEPRSFHRWFKSCEGTTPGEFRDS